jgi:hypothetical protein
LSLCLFSLLSSLFSAIDHDIGWTKEATEMEHLFFIMKEGSVDCSPLGRALGDADTEVRWR